MGAPVLEPPGGVGTEPPAERYGVVEEVTVDLLEHGDVRGELGKHRIPRGGHLPGVDELEGLGKPVGLGGGDLDGRQRGV